MIAIDTVTERLALAKEAGAETLDFMQDDIPFKGFWSQLPQASTACDNSNQAESAFGHSQASLPVSRVYGFPRIFDHFATTKSQIGYIHRQMLFARYPQETRRRGKAELRGSLGRKAASASRNRG